MQSTLAKCLAGAGENRVRYSVPEVVAVWHHQFFATCGAKKGRLKNRIVIRGYDLRDVPVPRRALSINSPFSVFVAEVLHRASNGRVCSSLSQAFPKQAMWRNGVCRPRG